jgi:hypothetical protein
MLVSVENLSPSVVTASGAKGSGDALIFFSGRERERRGRSMCCRFVARSRARGCLSARYEIFITKNKFSDVATTIV